MDHVDQRDHCLLQIPQKEANSTYTRDISLNIRHCRWKQFGILARKREEKKFLSPSIGSYLETKREIYEKVFFFILLWVLFVFLYSFSFSFSLVLCLLYFLLFPNILKQRKLISFLIFLNVLRKAYHRQNNQLPLLFLSYFFCFITISFHDFQTLA